MVANNVVPDVSIDVLNGNLNLDIGTNLNNNYLAPLLEDMNITSKYYDVDGFANLQSYTTNEKTNSS